VHANSPILGVIGRDTDNGCEIKEIIPGSAAEKAQLKSGDVIIRFDGKSISNFQELADTMLLYGIGSEVTVGVLRDGKFIEIDVVLQKRPSAPN